MIWIIVACALVVLCIGAGVLCWLYVRKMRGIE